MKSFSWRWLVLATIPACVLIEPLDKAAPDSTGDDSNPSKAGTGAKGNGSAGSSANGGASHSGGSSVSGGAGGKSSAGGASPRGGSGGVTPDGSGGQPSGGEDLTLFTGTWLSTSGTEIVTCDGMPQSLDASNITEIWTLGATSDLVLSSSASSCSYRANASGRTATDVPGQQCASSGTNTASGDPFTEVDTIKGYAFVVSQNGLTASENLSGSANITDLTSGLSEICPFTETAQYTKE